MMMQIKVKNVMVVFVMYLAGESTQCQCIFHVFATTLYLHYSCFQLSSELHDTFFVLLCILQDMDTLAKTIPNPNRTYRHITVNSISELCHYIVQQKCHILKRNMTNKAFIFNLKIGVHNKQTFRPKYILYIRVTI